MALKKEAIEKIAAALKVDATKLIEALTAETETDIEIPEIHTFTLEELTARDTNHKAEGKREGENAGKEVGKELVVKDLKKMFGVEFEGKSLDKLTETIKAQLAKGDDGLKEQVKLLQEKVTEKETEINGIREQMTGAKRDAQLLGSFPKNRVGTFTDDEYLTLIKSTLKIEEIDGKTVVKKGDQVLRDSKTQDPLPIADALGLYFNERKWTEQEQQIPGGRGGGNTPAGGKASKLSELRESWEAQGKNAASVEFQQELNRVAKENPEFVFD